MSVIDWLLLWLVCSVVLALAVGAVIGAADEYDDTPTDWNRR